MRKPIHKDPVPDLISAAATNVARGEIDLARAAIRRIDQPGLVLMREEAYQKAWGPGGIGARAARRAKQARQRVGSAMMSKIFHRDRFVCRYVHCRRRTIAIPVLRALSRALPDLVPYHPNWKPVAAQILYWIYATSLEHYTSFPHGGTSDESNLLTACYQCNDLKNWLDADTLGWTVGAPDDSDWDGLESLLPQFRARGLAL